LNHERGATLERAVSVVLILAVSTKGRGGRSGRSKRKLGHILRIRLMNGHPVIVDISFSLAFVDAKRGNVRDRRRRLHATGTLAMSRDMIRLGGQHLRRRVLAAILAIA
jgi:hypothetical protein